MIRIALLICTLVLTALPAAAQDAWFTSDPINSGLGDVPDGMDRRTPRATMESFLSAAEAEDWDLAAHALDLSDIDPAGQAAAGRIRAQQLDSILDRKAIVDWTMIRSRPDALRPMGGQQEATAGSPRRSLLIAELNLDLVPGSIRLNRLKPGEDADPIWVFPRETVADIPALYAAYGPSQFEALLPEVLRSDSIWGLMWWELIGLPLLIGVALVLAWVLRRVFDAAAARAKRRLTTQVLSAVATPTVIVAVTALVWFATDTIFTFSGPIDIFLSPLIAVGFVTAALMLVVNVAEALLDNLIAPGQDVDLTKADLDESRALATKVNAAKRILVIALTLVGAGVVLSSADLFRTLGVSLLASAGALTLVLGFAARDVLGNIMSSLQIALNQSARVGDRVVYKGELCHVERIHMTFVQLRDWDGTRVVVPVKEFVSETFSNWTLSEPAMLKILKFKLDPRTDVSGLRDGFQNILDEMSGEELGEELGDLSDASVNVAGQDVFGMDVWFSVPCADPNSSFEVACRVRERLLRVMADMAETAEHPVFPDAPAAEAA